MKNEEIKIWEEDFAIVKSKKFYENAFCNIKDDKEITVIIDQNKINEKDIIEIDQDWKLITINIIFKFDIIGITSKISTALAKAGISIMPISAYSRDHILVKQNKLKQAIEILKEI